MFQILFVFLIILYCYHEEIRSAKIHVQYHILLNDSLPVKLQNHESLPAHLPSHPPPTAPQKPRHHHHHATTILPLLLHHPRPISNPARHPHPRPRKNLPPGQGSLQIQGPHGQTAFRISLVGERIDEAAAVVGQVEEHEDRGGERFGDEAVFEVGEEG